MTLFGRGHGAITACRPGVRVIRVPVRRRAIPALPAPGATRPRGRHRVPIAVLLAGRAGQVAVGAAAAGVILASLQRFLLAYSGVFALVALTAAVAAGLAATDRLVVSPAGRVTFQAVHRALSLAALGFLASHVLLEVLARRSHAADAVVPFLAAGRAPYLSLGTLASDLILLIAITGVARRGFASHWTAAWRGVHVTAYLAWPLAILHGLLSGRPAKPYVDWSYGACVAAVAVALVVRLVAPRRTRTLLASTPPPRTLLALAPPPLPKAGPDPAPGLAAPGLPVYLSAPVQQGGYLPAPPPAYPALPAGSHDGGTQYGVVYGIVDDGVPRDPETP
jgi:DMSO/TMAO reductase YedYZ heme-binding membrane subunit